MYSHGIHPLGAKMNDIYDTLSDIGAKLYRGIGICSISEVSVPIASAILDSDTETAESGLVELVNAHLIEEKSTSLYRVLPVVTAHACGTAKTRGCTTEEVEVLNRVSAVLLSWLHQETAKRELEPASYSPAQQALTWIQDTMLTITKAVLKRIDSLKLAEQLTVALQPFVSIRGRTDSHEQAEAASLMSPMTDPRVLYLREVYALANKYGSDLLPYNAIA